MSLELRDTRHVEAARSTIDHSAPPPHSVPAPVPVLRTSAPRTRSVIRRLIDLTAVLLIALLVFAWLRASDAASRPQPPAPFDWSAVSTRDLDIASVFLTAKSQGVGRAMDSLSALVKHDSTLGRRPHDRPRARPLRDRQQPS